MSASSTSSSLIVAVVFFFGGSDIVFVVSLHSVARLVSSLSSVIRHAHTDIHRYTHPRQRIPLKWNEKRILTNRYCEHERVHDHRPRLHWSWASFVSISYVIFFHSARSNSFEITSDASVSADRDFACFRLLVYLSRNDCNVYWIWMSWYVVAIFLYFSCRHKISTRCACQFTAHLKSLWIGYCRSVCAVLVCASVFACVCVASIFRSVFSMQSIDLLVIVCIWWNADTNMVHSKQRRWRRRRWRCQQMPFKNEAKL